IFLYHDVESGRHHVEGVAAQREYLAIHHDVDRSVELKINLLRLPPLGQGMVDMSAVVERRQIAIQSQPSDRPPTQLLDPSVVDCRLGSDHHGSAGEFAVAESEEQAGPPVQFRFPIDAQRERTPPETSQADEDRGLVAYFAPAAETAGPQRGHVSG